MRFIANDGLSIQMRDLTYSIPPTSDEYDAAQAGVNEPTLEFLKNTLRYLTTDPNTGVGNMPVVHNVKPNAAKITNRAFAQLDAIKAINQANSYIVFAEVPSESTEERIYQIEFRATGRAVNGEGKYVPQDEWVRDMAVLARQRMNARGRLLETLDEYDSPYDPAQGELNYVGYVLEVAVK